MAPGTRGISPPNMITEETQLLGIYAVLTYIFITFPRNAYQSNGFFSDNSLVGVNSILGGLELILQPPYLCSFQTYSPKAQPKGIFQESLILQPSQIFTKNQDLLRLCKESDHLK